MKKKEFHEISRRSFLKGTAAGAAALGLGPMILSRKRAEAFSGGMSPHPNMNPLRVVGLHDPKMTVKKEGSERSLWDDQEKLIAPKRIEENLDKLACALAEEKNPKDAWKKLIIKPPGKQWSDTVVAIKTNNIALQHTRSPVHARLCKALTRIHGVKASNIFIYDACHGRVKPMSKFTPFSGLPEGVQIVDAWGGSDTKTAIPKPWHDGTRQAECISHLAKDKVDILINVSMCKGHYPQYGQFTMTMKNHFGTFSPRPHAHSRTSADTDFLFGINKTPEVLGKLDAKTGRVLFPRQQLCIVDALWTSQPGPMQPPTVQPDRLFMGTFSPVVEYLVATNYRRDTMQWSIEENVTKRFLSEFGYSHSDLPDKGKLVEVT